MRNAKFVLITSLMLLAAPGIAADRFIDVTGWATYLEPKGGDGSDDFDLDFDGETGYGLGVTVYLGSRLSVQVAANAVEPEAAIQFSDFGGAVRSAEGLEMIPITAALQLHLLGASRFDPYIGGGIAYVLFDDLDEISDINDTDIRSINLDDDYGFVANAGLNLGITDGFAINVDAKYIPLESETTVVFDRGDFVDRQELQIDPLLISAGISLRF